MDYIRRVWKEAIRNDGERKKTLTQTQQKQTQQQQQDTTTGAQQPQSSAAAAAAASASSSTPPPPQKGPSANVPGGGGGERQYFGSKQYPSDSERSLLRKVAKGRWMLREMVGVIQLSKYRALKKEYLNENKRFDRSGEEDTIAGSGVGGEVQGAMEDLEKKGKE